MTIAWHFINFKFNFSLTQKLLPLRHKQIHGTLVHSSIKYAIDFTMNRLSEKLRSRVHVYTKIEDIKSIDRKILPREYGGVMPMKEMIGIFKNELRERRDLLLNHDKMNVRFELYPEPVRRGSISALNIPLDAPVDAFNEKKEMYGMSGLQGSFRKLEFDWIYWRCIWLKTRWKILLVIFLYNPLGHMVWNLLKIF